MSNALKKYMMDKDLNSANLSRMLKCHPTAVFNWVHGKGAPCKINAWKLHKLSKGAVPITEWGYSIINGKFVKLCDGPIKIGVK